MSKSRVAVRLTQKEIVMQMDIQTPAISKGMLWTGRIISTLIVLFMLMDAVMKLVQPEAVVKGTAELGYPVSSIGGIGIALLIATILYAIPQTSVLGAILLTGYLGGAVASEVRIGATPLASFPFIFGVLVWLGLVLRDSRLRALIPLRS
jgi:sorbitol-specific phosphotransferase system component IIC